MGLLSDQTKLYIEIKTDAAFGRAFLRYANGNRTNVKELIETLDKLLEIPNPDTGKQRDQIAFGAGYAEKLNDAVKEALEKADQEILNSEKQSLGFIQIEAMLKKVLRMKEPQKWEAEWAKHERGEIGVPFNLAPLYREFGVMKRAEQYSGKKLDLNEAPEHFLEYPDFTMEYVMCYQKRNDVSHATLASVSQYLFFVYLDVVYRNKELIDREYFKYVLNGTYHIDDLCAAVCEEYSDKFEEYELLNWKNKNNEIITAKELEKAINKGIVMLTGPAGVGKSEALKYYRYLCCLKYSGQESEDAGGTRVPVIISLIDFNDTDDGPKSITEKLCAIFQVEEKNLSGVLESGSISLYLDGLNEILDREIQNKIRYELLNVIMKKYPRLPILITDRSMDIGQDLRKIANCYKLVPPDEKQLVSLLNKKITAAVKNDRFIADAEKEKKIKELKALVCENGKLKENLKWITKDTEMQRPYAVECVAHFIKMNGRIPDQENFWYEYLNSILDRESYVKQDTSVELLCSLLSKLVKKYNEQVLEGLSEQEWNEFLNENFSNSEIEEKKHFYELCRELKIFCIDGGNYRFANEYFVYYFDKYMWQHTEE